MPRRKQSQPKHCLTSPGTGNSAVGPDGQSPSPVPDEADVDGSDVTLPASDEQLGISQEQPLDLSLKPQLQPSFELAGRPNSISQTSVGQESPDILNLSIGHNSPVRSDTPLDLVTRAADKTPPERQLSQHGGAEKRQSSPPNPVGLVCNSIRQEPPASEIALPATTPSTSGRRSGTPNTNRALSSTPPASIGVVPASLCGLGAGGAAVTTASLGPRSNPASAPAAGSSTNTLNHLESLVQKVAKETAHMIGGNHNGDPLSALGHGGAGGGLNLFRSASAINGSLGALASLPDDGKTFQDLWVRFMKQERSSEHKKASEAKQIFTCLQCHQSFNTMEGLVKHMQLTKHFAEIPKHYSWSMQHSRQKMRQIRVKMKYSDRMMYYCHLCQSIFAESVLSHFSAIHKMTDPVQCMIYVQIVPANKAAELQAEGRLSERASAEALASCSPKSTSLHSPCSLSPKSTPSPSLPNGSGGAHPAADKTNANHLVSTTKPPAESSSSQRLRPSDSSRQNSGVSLSSGNTSNHDNGSGAKSETHVPPAAKRLCLNGATSLLPPPHTPGKDIPVFPSDLLSEMKKLAKRSVSETDSAAANLKRNGIKLQATSTPLSASKS